MGAAFLPDGTLMSANMDGTVSRWDLATSTERAVVRGRSLPTPQALAVGGERDSGLHQ